jgi:hypothetical protein
MAFFSIAAGPKHALVAQETERICFDILANFFHRMAGGNEFSFIGGIDPVKAGRNGRGTTNSHMDLNRARTANHLNNLTARRAANN